MRHSQNEDRKMWRNIILLMGLLLIPNTILRDNLVSTSSVSSDNIASTISAMKHLLTTLFERYKRDMKALKSVVMSSNSAVNQMEANYNDLSLRLQNLETRVNDILALRHNNVINDDEIVERSSGKPSNTHLDNDRLEKLEELSRTYAARTCYELKLKGVSKSGRYYIDPDGNELDSHPPIEVHCDMRTGITRIDHKMGSGEQRILSCQEPGCSVHVVEYHASASQIKSLMTLSGNCEQHIRYDCKGAQLNKLYPNLEADQIEPLAWWTDPNGDIHFYWFGNGEIHEEDRDETKDTFNFEQRSRDEAMGCYCSSSNILCRQILSGCMCDLANESTWLRDEGHVTNKKHLPVMKLNFGGNQGIRQRQASFELGPLYCSGKAKPNLQSSGYVNSSPTSCHDLLLKGVTQVGYYMVKSRKEKFPKVIFCDMLKQPDDAGFQRTFGSPGNLRHFAAFDASLNEPFYDDYRYINFSNSHVNIGDLKSKQMNGNNLFGGSRKRGAFNLQDGIFIVPVTGVYLFSVHAMPRKGNPCRVQIHHNGNTVASISNGEDGNSMVGQSILLQAAEGDEIRLYNNGGDIDENVYTRDNFLHFVGVLLFSSDRH